MHDKEAILVEWPSRCVLHFLVRLGCGLGKTSVLRDDGVLGHAVVVLDVLIHHDNGTVGLLVVGRGGAHELVRPRDGSDVHDRAWNYVGVNGVVAHDGPRIKPIGRGHPGVVHLIGATIHIVPTRVDQKAVLVHAGLPLVGLVVAERLDPRAVGVHDEERVDRHRSRMAATVPSAAVRDEDDPSVGKPGGIEVVVVSLGQLGEPSAIDVDLEDVVGGALRPGPPRSDVGIGEKDLLGVKAEVRGQKPSAFEALSLVRAVRAGRAGQHVLLRGTAGEDVFQDEETAPRLVIEAVVLIADVGALAVVVGGQEVALDEEDLVQIGELGIREIEAACGSSGRILALECNLWGRGIRGGVDVHLLGHRRIQLEHVLDEIVDFL